MTSPISVTCQASPLPSDQVHKSPALSQKTSSGLARVGKASGFASSRQTVAVGVGDGRLGGVGGALTFGVGVSGAGVALAAGRAWLAVALGGVEVASAIVSASLWSLQAKRNAARIFSPVEISDIVAYLRYKADRDELGVDRPMMEQALRNYWLPRGEQHRAAEPADA